MKKILLSVFLSASISLPTLAVGPLPKVWTVKQSDSTSIKIMVKGEGGRTVYYASLDGKIIVKGANNDFYYAVINDGKLQPSTFIAHEAGDRTAEERAFLNEAKTERKMYMLNSAATRAQQAIPRKAISASTADGLGEYNKTGMGGINSIGTPQVPVVMVEFRDKEFLPTTTPEKMTRYYNEAGYHDEPGCVGSVKDFFTSQSRGMFVPTFEVIGPIKVNHSYAYYGKNERTSDLVRDVVKEAKAQNISFDKFKNPKTGHVELICLFYAGRGQATEDPSKPGYENYIWPQEQDINETIEGTPFNSYFVGNELNYYGTLMGMGVFCHEFGHALGLPDFYNTDPAVTLSRNPFGYWSIMDAGPYVNNANAPIGYTAYERSYLGWLKLKELTSPQTVKLDPISNKDGELAAIVRSPRNRSEYFILENRTSDTWYPKAYRERRTNGYDTFTFGDGLMLSHFAYDKQYWEYNSVNTVDNKMRAYIIPADNEQLNYSAHKENLYGVEKKSIDKLAFYDGVTIQNAVQGIEVNADGTIVFGYRQNPTAIENITEATDENKGDGYYYDLQGRRVQNPTRGIYIHNGKKIVVK
ncbi:MAG: M6 family metalloprotease domain-containing protein [Prevotella pallens]|jgi:M6 family metalloprotease domain protein|nr:M6 family metalloprotease domain-containing protein [Prevotella pallens]